MKQKTNLGDPLHPSRKKRLLQPEEEALWQQVRKTVQPVTTKRQNLKHWLDENSTQPFENSISKKPPDIQPAPQPSRQYSTPDYSPPISNSKFAAKFPSLIDNKTTRKLAKGKQTIDARIDLHGMTQERAHRVLLNFVFQQYFAGSKMVLVITGKGRMSEGVLRNAVPRWLQEPQLAEFVSAFRNSHIAHGGEGALYVRLRNKDRFERRKK